MKMTIIMILIKDIVLVELSFSSSNFRIDLSQRALSLGIRKLPKIHHIKVLQKPDYYDKKYKFVQSHDIAISWARVRTFIGAAMK